MDLEKITQRNSNVNFCKCDFCEKEAFYDGKTKMGPWAYMCHTCLFIQGMTDKPIAKDLPAFITILNK